MEFCFRIKTQSDKRIFETVEEALGEHSICFGLHVELITKTEFDCTSENENECNRLKEVLTIGGELVRLFRFELGEQMQLVIERDDAAGTTTCRLRHTGNAQVGAKTWENTKWLHLTHALRTNLIATDSSHYNEVILGKELAEHYSRRDEELDRLQAMVAEATDRLSQHQKEVTKTVAASEKRLRAEQVKKDAEKDAELADLKVQIEEKERALVEREKELDDRNNMHVRREIRQQWLTRIEERFNEFALTQGTQKMRTPVTTAVIAGLVLSAMLIVWSVYTFTMGASSGEGNWYILALVKGAIGGISFFSLLSYYLHWQNQWLERHAKAEFGHMQMALDVERASWVVEMALEWNKDGEHPISDALLEQLTRNMFAAEGSGEATHRKSDDFLLTMLGASSKFEVDVAGNKITLNRKGCKQIAKEVKEDDAD